MNRKHALFTLATMLTCSFPAVAGQRRGGDLVSIERWHGGGGRFGGSLAAAYNSSDAKQSISCEVSSTRTTSSAYCKAQDASGSVAECWTDNERLLTELRNINPESYVSIDFDAQADCISVFVQTSSAQTPKAR